MVEGERWERVVGEWWESVGEVPGALCASPLSHLIEDDDIPP